MELYAQQSYQIHSFYILSSKLNFHFFHPNNKYSSMIYSNTLTQSFHSQSITQNKQNYQENLTENVQHAKSFSNQIINTTHSRHSTLTEKKPFIQTKKNKTIIGLQSQKVKNNKTRKLSDIYVQNELIQNKKIQKQCTSKQPLKLIINQDKKQTPINENLNSQKEKKFLNNDNSKGKKTNKQNNKSSKKTPKKIINQEKQTPSSLLKNELQESDMKLHLAHKNQLSQCTDLHNFFLTEILVSCSHVIKPIKQNYTINYVFNRHPSCAFSEPVIFHLPTNNDQVLHSEKTSRILSSQFKIFLNKRGEQFQLGKLKSNFTGSVYNFYPKDFNQISFSIIFSSKKSDSSQQLRYCQIYINKDFYSSKTNQSQGIVPFNKISSLQEFYVLNSLQNKTQNPIIKLKSKLPSWSQSHQSYILNFGTKSIFQSVKNTIILDENEKEVMKFYKNSHLTYNISIQNPFSWILAYGYALASTDFKISTQ